MQPLIILGSSSSDGSTYSMINKLGYKIFDINKSDISFFDYTQNNANDDFNKVIEDIINFHDRIILATPIYWYTMSAQMKMFLDRFNDLIVQKKKYLLKDKILYVLSLGYGNVVKDFAEPFRLTADYMHIKYGGCLILNNRNSVEDNNQKLDHFKTIIDKYSIFDI